MEIHHMNYNKPPVLPAWAESAANPADVVQPTNEQIQAGWPLTGTPPSRQRFNWILNFCANAVRYFSHRGLPDYDAEETYSVGDRVIGTDGKTYVSLQDNNLGQFPSAGYWMRWGHTADEFANFAFNAPTTNAPASGDNGARIPNTAWVRALVGGLGGGGVQMRSFTANITDANGGGSVSWLILNFGSIEVAIGSGYAGHTATGEHTLAVPLPTAADNSEVTNWMTQGSAAIKALFNMYDTQQVNTAWNGGLNTASLYWFSQYSAPIGFQVSFTAVAWRTL